MQELDLCRSGRAASPASIQCGQVHGHSCRQHPRSKLLNPLVRGLLCPERIVVATVKVTVTKVDHTDLAADETSHHPGNRTHRPA
jgi:hypothetical protein